MPTVLADGTFYTESTGIAINGTDVYVTEQGPQSGYWENTAFIHPADCYETSNIVVVSK
jgi:hypothetical protein